MLAWAVAAVARGAGAQVPVSRREAFMADRTAGPEDPGDKVSPGKKPDSPDRATADGHAGSRKGAGQRDEAAAKDEAQSKFRAALERKRARETGVADGHRGMDGGKIHGAHGPASNRRQFRRKSG